ncbi:uncharacterized protein LOC125178027 [Hyalella azteca]|uniref:Uncharacterized protein LOC125178027 n=1 Tax=Hyalella azteca TaxID=294128 RepID=A0A979FJV7_HYAAZ|nr:uncharacterized protein LOC125178027 [Hyalella azteca]
MYVSLYANKLERVQTQFTSELRKKDETIACLRQELEETKASLRHQRVLAIVRRATPLQGSLASQDPKDKSSRDGETTSRDGETTSRDGDPMSRDGEPMSRDGETTSRDGETTLINDETTSRDGETTSRGDVTMLPKNGEHPDHFFDEPEFVFSTQPAQQKYNDESSRVFEKGNGSASQRNSNRVDLSDECRNEDIPCTTEATNCPSEAKTCAIEDTTYGNEDTGSDLEATQIFQENNITKHKDQEQSNTFQDNFYNFKRTADIENNSRRESKNDFEFSQATRNIEGNDSGAGAGKLSATFDLGGEDWTGIQYNENTDQNTNLIKGRNPERNVDKPENDRAFAFSLCGSQTVPGRGAIQAQNNDIEKNFPSKSGFDDINNNFSSTMERGYETSAQHSTENCEPRHSKSSAKNANASLHNVYEVSSTSHPNDDERAALNHNGLKTYENNKENYATVIEPKPKKAWQFSCPKEDNSSVVVTRTRLAAHRRRSLPLSAVTINSNDDDDVLPDLFTAGKSSESSENNLQCRVTSSVSKPNEEFLLEADTLTFDFPSPVPKFALPDEVRASNPDSRSPEPDVGQVLSSKNNNISVENSRSNGKFPPNRENGKGLKVWIAHNRTQPARQCEASEVLTWPGDDEIFEEVLDMSFPKAKPRKKDHFDDMQDYSLVTSHSCVEEDRPAPKKNLKRKLYSDDYFLL